LIRESKFLHDFLLAKEIVDEILKISREKKLSKIRKVSLEIGEISMAHDGFDEHVEDISIENLKFGLQSIAKNTILEEADFDIKKTAGKNWKILNIETDEF
jgi:Zn finger protein HypA/HybF involved in hydrogenase expression